MAIQTFIRPGNLQNVNISNPEDQRGLGLLNGPDMPISKIVETTGFFVLIFSGALLWNCPKFFPHMVGEASEQNKTPNQKINWPET